MSLLLFALDVFSPSRGTYVQLRGEENAILHQSHKPVVAISAQERAKSDIATVINKETTATRASSQCRCYFLHLTFFRPLAVPTYSFGAKKMPSCTNLTSRWWRYRHRSVQKVILQNRKSFGQAFSKACGV